MYLINGQWQNTIPANDRSISFGDGCFTTALICENKIQFKDAHIRRLQRACEVLMIRGVNWKRLSDEMEHLAIHSAESRAVLKVLISRGSGARGYRIENEYNPMCMLSISAYPEVYALWRDKGISLSLSPVQLGINPHLAGIKHLNRLEQVLIRAHLEETKADEALVMDSDGYLVACCAANLFWRKGRQVFTPYVDKAGVNGTMRQHIITLLNGSPLSLNEVREGDETLSDAEEVIICNALMPVIPVNQAENWRFHSRQLYDFLIPRCE